MALLLPHGLVNEVKTRHSIPTKTFCTHWVSVKFCLTRNGCILCYISFFTEFILQQLVEFQTEIQGFLTQLFAFRVSRGHPPKVATLPIIASGAENTEYLISP